MSNSLYCRVNVICRIVLANFLFNTYNFRASKDCYPILLTFSLKYTGLLSLFEYLINMLLFFNILSHLVLSPTAIGMGSEKELHLNENRILVMRIVF